MHFLSVDVKCRDVVIIVLVGNFGMYGFFDPVDFNVLVSVLLLKLADRRFRFFAERAVLQIE